LAQKGEKSRDTSGRKKGKRGEEKGKRKKKKKRGKILKKKEENPGGRVDMGAKKNWSH